MHAWQEATLDDFIGPNYVWHVRDDVRLSPNGLLAVHPVLDEYRSMMRLDVVPPAPMKLILLLDSKLVTAIDFSDNAKSLTKIIRILYIDKCRLEGALSCNHGEKEENATEVVRYGMVDEMKATVNTPET
ncbi:hypothetical protein IFM89_030459 [Coptis chinensis]|uniref:Uncharacterized protein n=1 Tax=Coptis chinensis TaxID=261450 RepID=A0A835H8K7_9MAGN|nr:hypothetical protein IFM89_030459 [Coptis chinensis]